MVTLQELYRQALATPSDIREHLDTLCQLARGCGHVTEMGTRWGISTRAFLHAQPEVLVCYDLIRHSEVDLLETVARAAGRPHFLFVQADVCRVEIDETDLLFIDTWHVYEQMKQELALHAGKSEGTWSCTTPCGTARPARLRATAASCRRLRSSFGRTPVGPRVPG